MDEKNIKVSTQEASSASTLVDTKRTTSKFRQFWQGTLAMLPLSIAVIPWGILAGSFAIDAGLTGLEGQSLSLFVFAGAAQLVVIGMIKSGAGLLSIALTNLLITSRHLLYSLAMRRQIKPMPLRWRLSLGFLLTDELFAVCGNQNPEQFQRWYALGAGLSFYLCWNAATLVGILAGHSIPNLDQFGLDFAVAATFIALVVPKIVSRPVFVTVVVALLSSLILEYYAINGSLMIASLTAMIAGYLMQLKQNKTLQNHQLNKNKDKVKSC